MFRRKSLVIFAALVAAGSGIVDGRHFRLMAQNQDPAQTAKNEPCESIRRAMMGNDATGKTSGLAYELSRAEAKIAELQKDFDAAQQQTLSLTTIDQYINGDLRTLKGPWAVSPPDKEIIALARRDLDYWTAQKEKREGGLGLQGTGLQIIRARDQYPPFLQRALAQEQQRLADLNRAISNLDLTAQGLNCPGYLNESGQINPGPVPAGSDSGGANPPSETSSTARPQIIAPAPGSTLSSSSAISWSSGAGVTEYFLTVSAGSGPDRYWASQSLGMKQSATVTGLHPAVGKFPTDGSPVTVRLSWLINGSPSPDNWTEVIYRGKSATSRAFPEPPPPEKRGMRSIDDRIFLEKAKAKAYFIIVRDSNPDAVQWIGKRDDAQKVVYKAKPENLKAKTLKTGDYKGLAAANPNDDRLIELLAARPPPTTPDELKKNPDELQRRYESFKEELARDGYFVEDAKDYLVWAQQGPMKAYFHGDYDLHGIYDQGNGKLVNSQQTRDELNQEFGLDLILHGAHDEWEKRNDPSAGPNRGPQPPVTVYLPDGTRQHLVKIMEMKQFYLDHGLDWKTAYPDI